MKKIILVCIVLLFIVIVPLPSTKQVNLLEKSRATINEVIESHNNQIDERKNNKNAAQTTANISLLISIISVTATSLTFLVHFLNLCLTKLGGPKLKFYTDGRIDVPETQGINGCIEINFLIFNHGNKPGQITDVLLTIDDRYVLIPNALGTVGGFSPIIVKEHESVQTSIPFICPGGIYSDFNFNNYLGRQQHTYEVKVRIDCKQEWEPVLTNTFAQQLTVDFMNARNIVFDQVRINEEQISQQNNI